ncbi:MAG: HEAT repeat domain-containing protein [Gemmatimonadales bacterium]
MSADVEALLAETGKAFRLCRLYPATHPSVQHSLAVVSSLLPGLTSHGAVELKITPTGFAFENHPVGARNTQVQELAGLLYAQGHRFAVLEPGVRAEEIAALIQIAGAGEKRRKTAATPAAANALVHLKLSRASRMTRHSAPQVMPATPREDVALGKRSFAEFRPDALPPAIEARRLAVALGQGGVGGVNAAQRLGGLVEGLLRLADYHSLAVMVRALGRAANGEEEAVAAAARRVIAEKVTSSVLSGLMTRLADATQPPDDRDETAHALAALGAPAIGPVADRFLVSGDAEERDILAAVVRLARDAAIEPLLLKANPDARGDAACAWIRLLAATRSARATPMLVGYARHAEPAVRQAAAAALAHLEDPEARRQAAAALRDPDPKVRAAAARGIARYGEPSSAPILMARLSEEVDEDAVATLMEALGELRDARAVPQLIEISKAVIGPFQRRAPKLRIAAIRALGAIGTDEALAVVRERVDSGTAEVRAAALKTLDEL